MKLYKRIYRFVILFSGLILLSSFAFSRPPVVKTVVIDAGHGGKDPGCHGEGAIEKHVALGVALKLGNYIEENFKDVKVVYTRKTDVFVELQERAAIANRAKADLFISIHCNSACTRDKKTHKENCNPDANGVETYVMGLSNEQGNLNVAKRENATILLEDNYQKNYEGFDPNSDEANIIFALYQNAYLQNSLSLASKIQKQYKDKAARFDRGVKRASLWVLWKTSMPSLLTEIGFLTNPDEVKFLGSNDGQKYVASCIFRAFRDYKNELEGKNIKYNDDIENQPALVNKPDTSNNNSKQLKAYTDSIAIADSIAEKNLADEMARDSIRKAEEKKAAIAARADSLSRLQQQITTKDSLRMERNKKEKWITAAKMKKEKDNVKTLPSDSLKRIERLKKTISVKDTSASPSNSQVSYKVQIITSGKRLPLDSEKFKGEQVSEYQADNIYKYTVGDLSDKTAAAKLQTEMRKKGFTDAFVVAFKDGKRIPVNDAR